MSLKTFRQEHPEYDDVSDQDLADAIYRKHYSDIPRQDFDQRMGLDIAAPDRASAVQLEGTDQTLAPEDPRAQGYSALNERGLLDPSKPKGSRENPRVIGDDMRRPPDGEWFVDHRGKLVQSSSQWDDIASGFVTGVGEGAQGLIDPESPMTTIPRLFGIDTPQQGGGYSPMDILQSGANMALGFGQRLAGDQQGAESSFNAARADTAQGRLDAQGLNYNPQTGAGQVSRLVGQMVPNALAPGSAPARLANVLAPAGGAFVGGQVGQAVGGDRGQVIGQVVGGVAGGGAAGLRTGPARPRVPVTAAQRLQAEGVQLTPGQLAGGILRGLEDKATSIPLVGDAIRGAKVRANDGFNRAMANRVLAPLGEEVPANIPAGRETVAYLQDRIDTAYDTVLGRVTVTRDAQLDADIQTIQQAAQMLPDNSQAQLTRIVDQLVNRRLQGPLSGREYKNIESEVGQMAADYGGSSTASERELGRLLGDLRGALRDTVARTNPNEAQALAAVDDGFANLTTIERAAAKTQDGNYSPNQARTAMRQGDRTVRKRATARGTARMQGLVDDAQAVLPSTIPDSGTAGRLMAGGAGFLAATNPFLAAGGLAMAGAYTRPGVAAINALSQARPPAVAYQPNYAVPLLSGQGQLQSPQRRIR